MNVDAYKFHLPPGFKLSVWYIEWMNIEQLTVKQFGCFIIYYKNVSMCARICAAYFKHFFTSSFLFFSRFSFAFILCVPSNVLHKLNNTCSNMRCHKIKANLHNTKRLQYWFDTRMAADEWLYEKLRIKIEWMNASEFNESKSIYTHTHTTTSIDSFHIQVYIWN